MLPHLKSQKKITIPTPPRIPSYQKYGYDRLRHVLNFGPTEIARFTVPTIKTDLDITEAAFKRIKAILDKMTAQLARVETLQKEEIELYSGPSMDNRMRNGILKIKELIDINLSPQEIPFYSEEFGRIDILFQNWIQERTRQQAQAFRTEKISYAGYLNVLQEYKTKYFSLLSKFYQEIVEKRIAMAEMKTEMFNTWVAIETCKLVVDGLRYLRLKFQQNVWEIILQKPIHRLRFAGISSLDQIEIERVCGLFAPAYRFVPCGNRGFNCQNSTLGYPMAQSNMFHQMTNPSQTNGADMVINRTIKEEPKIKEEDMDINDSQEAALRMQRYFQAK